MPIFENELSSNALVPETKLPQAPLGSPEISGVNTDLGGFAEQQKTLQTGLSLNDLSKVQANNTSNFDSPFQMVPKSELLENKRYALYERGKDLENIYGLQQSWYSQLGNGIAKFAATGLGTFAQGFATIPNTIKASKNGNLSDLSNPDGYEAAIDNWLKNLEDKFPNYYTRYEKEHPFLAAIPLTRGSANFWGDKFIKNIGFTVGAISSALVQDIAVGLVTEGLGEIPLVAAQVGKAALYLNKIFTGAKDLDKVLDLARQVGKTEQQVMNIKKMAELSAAVKLTNGFRYATNLYGASRTEAAVEARDGYRQVKEELLKQYRLDNLGMEPSIEDMQTIDRYAENAMNTRFGINMALLTVSNAIQFDNMLKVIGKAKAPVASSLTREIEDLGKTQLKKNSLDVFEKASGGAIKNAWERVRPTVPTMFSEGVFEEGGQYATEKGTYDYFTRKYKNPGDKNNVENWDTLNEVIKSTGYGLMQQFGTTEGIENMFIGALTGMFTDVVKSQVDRRRGIGKDARLNHAINVLNQYGLTGILNDKYSDTLDTIGIAKDMKAAAESNDVFKYKNLNHDMFFKFVISRIPSGMHDVTIDQLNLLKELPKEEFEKTFGMEFSGTNKATVNEYVETLIDKANGIKKTVDMLDGMYKNPFKNITNPTTNEEQKEKYRYDQFNDYKTELAYAASVAVNMDSRIESMNTSLQKINPSLDADLVSSLFNKKELTELANSYEQEAKETLESINENTTIEDRKKLRNKAKLLRTLSEKIKLNKTDDLNLVHQLLNFELNNHDSSKPDVVNPLEVNSIAEMGTDIARAKNLKQNVADIMVALSDKKGFEKFFEDAEVNDSTIEAEPTAHDFTNTLKDKETPIVGRSYANPISRPATYKKIADNRFEVTHPDGTSTFEKTEELAKDTVNEINSNLSDLSKVKVIALNPNGTIKVEDLSGNILNISPSALEGYYKVETEEEKLKKYKDKIDSEQENINKFSGDFPTGDPTSEEHIEEGKLKSVEIYPASGISESETASDPTKSAPHVKRSREFLNNAKNSKNRSNLRAILVTMKNEEALGLKGLTQMSYRVTDEVAASDDFKSMATKNTDGLIAQVFVAQVDGKLYFVDKNGEILNQVGTENPNILNEVIFQTMPSDSTEYNGVDKNGKVVKIPRYRHNEKDSFLSMIKSWVTKRTQIFENPNEVIAYPFTISRGIPVRTGTPEKNHVGTVLIPEEKIENQQELIVMSTTGDITHLGESLKFPKGRPVLQYDDTLQFLINNRFSDERAKTIYAVIKAFAKEIQDQGISGRGKLFLNPEYAEFLQKVLYYSTVAAKTANQIAVNTETMTIMLGKESYPISEIANFEQQIVSQLKTMYHNVNKTFLKSDLFNRPFTDFVLKDGQLVAVTWPNYQTYLLSSKNHDGSARSIDNTPLYTDVPKPTEGVPYSFMQKYATMMNFDVPFERVVKPKQKSEAPTPPSSTAKKIGKYFIDDKMVQTITVSKKEIDFVIVPNKDSELGYNIKLELTDKTQKVLKASAAKKEIVENLANVLKSIPGFTFNDKWTGEEIVAEFLKLSVISELMKIQQEEKASEETPTEETKPVEEQPEVKTDEYKPKKGRRKNADPNTRRVGKHEAGMQRLTDAEIELFKIWAQENVPNIPYEILDNVVTTYDNDVAWGVFEEGIAKFYKGAIRGTEYHEVFEGIWKAFLTPEQRQALLDEFKSKSGSFIDRSSGREIEYANATDIEAKERIADDFADYRVGKLPARSIGERIMNFFRSIIEFFKSFVEQPTLKKELFENINQGKFKDRTVPDYIKLETPEYSRIAGLTETQIHETVQDMTILAAQYIFGKDLKTLFDIPKITGKQVRDYIKDMYTEDGKFEELGEGRFAMLFDRTVDMLRSLLGITINEEDKLSINDEETTVRSYAAEPFTTDWKSNMNFAIKFLIATLPRTDATNQQNSTSLSLPEKKVSELTDGYLLNNYNRMFATLMDKLSNTSKFNNVVAKLVDLAKYDANFVRLFQRLGGDLTNGTLPIGNFNYEQWQLFIGFYQIFTKQRPEAVIQYVTGDNDVYTASAEIYGASRQLQNTWFQEMKNSAKDENSIIFWNKQTKTFQVKKLQARIEKVNNKEWRVRDYKGSWTKYDTEKEAKSAANELSFPIKTAKDKINFLVELGINITIDDYINMKSFQKKHFNDAVSAIRAYVDKTSDIGSLSGRTLGIGEPIATIANLLVKISNPDKENVHMNVQGTMSQSYENNNAPSLFENLFNESKTKDELLNVRPELNDIFSQHSVVLSKGGSFYDSEGNLIKSIKISHIEGMKNIDTGKGITIARLDIGNRFTQQLNQNLNGDYYILIPADSSREFMMNLGNHISFDNVKKNKAWNELYKIFHGYLIDDIALALDADNRKVLKNVGEKGKDLRFFKDILSERTTEGKLVPTALLEKINKMIDSGETQKEIERVVNENIDEINNAVKEFVTEKINDAKALLTDTRQVTKNSNSTFSYEKLDNKFINRDKINKLDKFNLTEDELNNILTFVQMNYVINNVEFHKILFGDPYQFAIKNGKLEETKRLKSFISPRRTTVDDPLLNTFLNDELNTVDGNKLTENDPGYHKNKSYLNTVTLADVSLTSETYPDIKYDETDGFSWLMDGAYRENKMKNAQWTDKAEKWHQWHMAYTRQNFPGYKYTSASLEEHDKALMKKPEPKFRMENLKPIVSGVKNGKRTIEQVVDKYSQMPLYFKHVQGKVLEALYVKMFKENIDYAVFASGRKVGVEKAYSLYVDGKLNSEPFTNDVRVEVPWSAYGIQVETAHEDEASQTIGSQITKISSMDMFDNGVPVSETAKNEYDRMTRALNAIHKFGYDSLLKGLGIEDTGMGFILSDPRAIAETLQYEMMRRSLSQNTKETITLDKNDQFLIPFEASPSYKKIKDIIYSVLHKSLIAMKMNGSPKVQVPSTLWENAKEGRGLVEKTKDGYKKITREQYEALSPERKENVIPTSDTLKFYKDEHGQRYCEIMIPHWFKNNFDKKKFPTDKSILEYLNNHPDGQDILTGIGFRIPTQAMSSIEIFKVKEFLPRSMGDMIVVPSEIVAKTNSDFDIDKLNTYLKAVYQDENGNVQLTKLVGSEEATKDFYGKVYDNTIGKKIAKIERYEEFREKLINLFSKLESVSAEEYEDVLTEEDIDFVDFHRSMINEIINQANEKDIKASEYIINDIERLDRKKSDLFAKLLNDKLKEDFVNKSYRDALMNEYYDAMIALVTIPENFKNLLLPVDDAGLSKTADQIKQLKGINEVGIKNRMLDMNYLTRLRHSFLIAKRWIGIVAVNITGHSFAQKIKLIIDPAKLKHLSKSDREILGNLSIALPHNRVTIGTTSYASMSGRTTADGKHLISSRLSGYATACVDVANNPYINDIITSDLLIGTTIFMERLGMGENVAPFINQPIIQEYVKLLDNSNYKFLYKKSNIDQILKKFPASDRQIQMAVINVDSLKNNISEYAEKGKFTNAQDNAVQQLILKEFLKYSKLAEFSFKLTQASNFDTTKFKDSDAFSRKKTKNELAKMANILSSVDNLMDANFVGVQKQLLDDAMSAMGAIFKLESDEFKTVVNKAMRPYEEKEFMGADTFQEIAARLNASFFDYIVQTRSGINDKILRLTTGDTSVANKLRQLKIARPELNILENFDIVGNQRINSPETIKLKVNPRGSAYEEDVYVEIMRELKEAEPQFYNDLLDLIILQGSYGSTISMLNVVPIEDYSAKIKSIFETLQPSKEIDDFALGSFQKNNWKNNDVFPEYKPSAKSTRMAGEDPIPVAYDHNGNEIYEYYFTTGYYSNVSAFPSIAQFGKESDRRILLIDPAKDSFSAQNDYLKIPRVITIAKNNTIDFLTGQTLLPSDFAARKAAGDLSLKDVFGYRKVRMADGKPLLTQKGEYVYKLINLLGDGQYVSEYYNDSRRSVLDNGTMKTDEIPDIDIINYYSQRIEGERVVEDVDAEDVTEEVPSTQEEAAQEKPEEKLEEKSMSILNSRKNSLNYTEGQKKALLDIEKIIDSEKQGYYLLAGYAGTGKTTVAENIAKYAKSVGKKVQIMAPTNKAARVLNSKLKSTGANVQATTIHRAIYGQPDPLTGQWKKSMPISNTVIIIDESSMISEDVLNDLFENTTNNNVLIFMGDSFQLEPIGKDPGLFTGKVQQVKTNKTELTEVKRQSLDSNVLKLATITRVDKKGYVPTTSMEDFKVTQSRQEFINDFKAAIKNNEDVAMIVATNNERMIMNTIARNEKFGPNKSVIENGEVLVSIANSSVYSNSEIFKVDDVDVNDFTKHTITMTLDKEFKKYDIYLGYIKNDEGDQVKVILVPQFDKASLYHSQLLEAISDSNKELYNSLDDDADILRTRRGEKLNPAIVIATYGYSVTAHKSQGSQWEKVFVNQNYVAPSWNAARWYYTAITRSAKDVIVLSGQNNVKISPEEITKKIDDIVTPEVIYEDDEAFENSLEITNFEKVSEFYNSLSSVDKAKLGSLEKLKEKFDSIPFTFSEEDFIDNLKCKL